MHRDRARREARATRTGGRPLRPSSFRVQVASVASGCAMPLSSHRLSQSSWLRSPTRAPGAQAGRQPAEASASARAWRTSPAPCWRFETSYELAPWALDPRQAYDTGHDRSHVAAVLKNHQPPTKRMATVPAALDGCGRPEDGQSVTTRCSMTRWCSSSRSTSHSESMPISPRSGPSQ